MTDKEQIMIDGVNVGGCKYLNTFSDSDGYHYYCDLADDIKNEYCEHYRDCYFKQLARKTQECEELKKQLMQKSEVDMFFNTPIEGWSNDPCGICSHKAENEELKKEIINKNEKIKELRFSVSDLTNRLCYLNAEKSFRIVDLEQALDEIKSICLKDVHTFADGTQLRYDSLDEILDIINKTKGEEKCQ